MANPGSSVSPFLRNSGSAAKAASGASPFLRKAPKKPAAANPWQPVLSFGQTLIDIISTPLYFVQGGIAGAQKGKNPVVSAVENAVAWTNGKRPATGADVLKNAGMSDDFWSSLAADIALDPLTYTPGVVISAPIKAALAGVKFGTKGLSAGAKGAISVGAAKLTKAKTGAAAEKIVSPSLPKLGKLTSDAAYQRVLQGQQKMEKLVYQPVQVEGQRSVSQALAQMLASGAEAAYKGAGMSIQKSATKYSVDKINRNAAKLTRKGVAVAAPKFISDLDVVDDVEKAVASKADIEPTPVEVVGEAANAARAENIPVIDEAPRKVTPLEASIIQKPLTPVKAKDLKTKLTKIDKLVQGIKGTAISKDNAKKELASLLGEGRQRVYSFFANEVSKQPDIAKNMGFAVKLDGTNPVELLQRYSAGQDATRRTLASILDGAVIATRDGAPVTVNDVLTKPEFAVAYRDLDADIKAGLVNMLNKYRMLATGGLDAVKTLNRKEMERLFGEKIAFEIEKTGALDPTKKTDDAALKAILDALPDASERSYASFDDFIKGIRAEDIIDTDAMKKVLRLLDPEGEATTIVEAAVKSGRSTDVLRSALIGKGVTTVASIRNQLLKLDPEMFMEASNISFSDLAFVATNDVLRGLQQADTAAAQSTRAAALENLANKRELGGLGAMIDDASDSIARGMTPQIGKIHSSTEAGISRLGEYYTRAYREDGATEAFIFNVFSQYVETKVLGSIFGKMTYRAGAKEAKQGEDFVPRTVAQVEAEFIARASLAREIVLGVHGARVTHVRSVAKAKGSKENAYHHYVAIDDVATIFKKYKSDLFQKLVLPKAYYDEGINAQMDSLSFQSIGDVVSAALEGLEKGKDFNISALANELRKASPSKTWSTAYTAAVEENIEEFVKFIGVHAEDFAEIHKSRLKAEIIDTIQPAQKMSTEMVDSMIAAYSVMKDKGITSQLEKDKIVYDWAMKFAALADAFAYSNGNVAREVFRSTARLFLELGKPEVTGTVVSEWRQKLMDLAYASPGKSDIYDEMMKAFETVYQREATNLSQIPGTTANLIDSAQKAWVVAKDDFQKSVEQLTTDLTPQQVLEWRKQHVQFEEALKASRKQMGKAGLETDYWNGTGWVTADRFNRRAAIKALEKMPNRYIYTKSGIIDVAKYLIDGAVETPTFKKYGIRHTAETRKFFEQQAAARRAKNATDDKANAQETVLAKLDEFDKQTPENPEAVIERMNEEVFVERHDMGRMKVDLETPPAGTMQADEITEAPTFTSYGSYKTAKREAGMTGLKLAGQKMQAGAGFRDVYPTLVRSESTRHNAVADTADMMTSAFRIFRRAKLETSHMDEAMVTAVSKLDASAITNPDVAELALILGKVWDSTAQHVVARGLHPKYLYQAFKMQGIDKFVPWDKYLGANGKPEDIDEILSWLPIGDAPAYVLNGLDSADDAFRNQSEAAFNQYQETKSAWEREMAKREDSVGSIAMFHKAIAAIQHASSEATLAGMLAEDFNFMQYYPSLSKEAARKAALKSGEFVKIKPAGNQHSLLNWIDEEDNLFPKDMAKQIAAMERHYNYTMENNMSKFLRNSMSILGIFKTTQTVLRPGHLVNTAIGDTITSLMRGTNPLLFKDAARIAMTFAGDKVQADWVASAAGKRMAMLEGSLGGLSKREIKEAETGFTFSIGGKKTLSLEDVTQLMRNGGALKTNIAANDEMIQMTELQSFAAGTDQGMAYNKTLLEKMNAKGVGSGIKRAWLTGTKPAGDAVAYVGNIPRVATALDVLKKGSFKTVEDAERAIAAELAIYHPMMESLSAFERQKIRPWFSYYTWLRGAHVAMLKMALEHTRALTIPSKVFYNQALANGMEPGSIGNLWGDKEDTPGYLNYSTYGPTSQGPRGGLVYRPAILPLDVLDTWNIQFDSTKAIDKQAFDNLQSVGQTVVGKNLNMVFQPGLEWLTGADPSTGRPSKVKDIQTAGDNLLSNIGTMQLFQGLGLYTPPDKGPESTNPLTDRDRALKILNYFGGMRVSDVATPSNERNAKIDQNARVKRVLEEIQKGQTK